MGRFYDLVNSPVHALGEYSSGMPTTVPSSRSGTPLLRLNANESPYGPSPRAIEAMRTALDRSHWYPDDHSASLRARLADVHEVRPEQILIANGTTSLLGVMARTLLGPGRNAVTSACSFISYPMVTRAAGATLIETPLRDGGYDLDAILAAIDANTRLVYIANPNNPTGTLLDATSVREFLDRVPAHVIVVLDEAYYDYAAYFSRLRAAEYSESFRDVRSERNVVILRTFSKAHGLAGIRVGYGMGPAELMAYLGRMQDTFAVSSIAQAAALAALDDEAHVRFAVENNAKQAEGLNAEVQKLGYPVTPTWANFLHFNIGQDGREFARKLRREGVLVRPLSAWGAPTSIRVTVGTAEQNQEFLQALQRVSS
jgi:histidinol-phosphate aminotransferase